MNTLLIYLFASMKLEKGHKEWLGSNFKIMLSFSRNNQQDATL